MTKKEAIREVCRIVAMAYHCIGKYERASDGFCDMCPIENRYYRNDGDAIEFVLVAVLEKLKRDGIDISDEYDPTTGKPMSEPTDEDLAEINRERKHVVAVVDVIERIVSDGL